MKKIVPVLMSIGALISAPAAEAPSLRHRVLADSALLGVARVCGALFGKKVDMTRRGIGIAALLFALGVSAPASAGADWTFDGHVTDLESTYVPTEIPFYSDSGTASCPAGTMLHYLPQGADQESRLANIQANLSILATALASGKKVRLYGPSGSCVVQYVHILAD